MELYLINPGTKIYKNKESFCIETEDKKIFLSPEKIERIIIESEINLTSGVIRLAIKNDIPIIISNSFGDILGQFHKTYSSKNGELRKKQYRFFESDLGIELGKSWILEKINYQKKHLETLLKKRKKDLKPIFLLDAFSKKIHHLHGNTKETINEIMGFEGVASKIYFNTISSLLKEEWKFNKREHQNATLYYNIVLNYSFGILYHKLESYILKEEFDTNIGILHTIGHNKLPFLYDFIEKYRYVALESTYELFSKRIIDKNFFTTEDKKKLTLDARKEISTFIKNKLKVLKIYHGKKYKLEDIIQLELKNLKKIILGENL